MSLADRIGAGDPEAERELVERYAPLVERLLRATVDRWRAEDLLQETMVSVIARLRRKRLDDPSGLEGYVKQTARKPILAAYRKSRPSFPIPPAGTLFPGRGVEADHLCRSRPHGTALQSRRLRARRRLRLELEKTLK